MSAGLPHHRRGPRIDERRREDADESAIVHLAIALGYVAGVLVLVYLAAFVAGTV